jgi:FixJ family two-component response regulator
MPRILIVDDDHGLLESLSRLITLRIASPTVDCCDSAIAALQRVQDGDYDAIISDIKMPVMDGMAFMMKVKKLRPDIPTLLITGHGDHDLAVHALNAGAYAFVSKPLDRDFFVAWLKRALDLRQLHRQAEEQNTELERMLTNVVIDSQRQTAEAEQAKLLLQVLLDHIPDGVTIAGGPPEYPIIANSKRAQEVVGKPAEALMGMPIGGHVDAFGIRLPNGTRPDPEQLPLYRATRHGQTITNEEWLIQRTDGTQLRVLVNTAPIRNRSNEIFGAINCWRLFSISDPSKQPDATENLALY